MNMAERPFPVVGEREPNGRTAAWTGYGHQWNDRVNRMVLSHLLMR
ncbi:hypothetical protein FBZ85_105160 [Azospirillum brasilense]|uniref:Uncharacterized protein n=1 Tax=Azospirillum baldaniorum TaxID=1064539 RepID=A0A9P1JPG6_9PROT|nr:hypothetical protein FBZ84_103159 [Azospirillum baldaniorum]TWA78856.1 hypothetical protein FBZ85_105160 [Azospirillum brasilense]CCC97164.1 protein of unknown function [Azospirillum baldaniorum]